MRMNWLAYYLQADGYGRLSSRFVAALLQQGVEVYPLLEGHEQMPQWMADHIGIDWSALTISCLPPRLVRRLPQTRQHWVYSMCESSTLPKSWIRTLHRARIGRLLVPCQHNAEVFAAAGVKAPISVVPGGIDPLEFPVITQRPDRPYTFLALADRGDRKGYMEVYDAFYKAFGGKTTGVQDVRLILKNRHRSNRVLRRVSRAENLDARLTIIEEDVPSMASIYAQADCFAIPSYSEGWGLPHREAAAMGLTVITQKYSGMDDGHTDQWAYVVEGGTLQKGGGMKPNVKRLAEVMRDCYEDPDRAFAHGQAAAQWLRANQTWAHSAAKLLSLTGTSLPATLRQEVSHGTGVAI